MGLTTSAAKPLAPLFADATEGRRGPVLGSALARGPEGSLRLFVAAPLRLQVFDAHTAEPVAEELPASAPLRAHAPFAVCCVGEEADEAAASAAAAQQLALGCQDGTVLVLALARGAVIGPTLVFCPDQGSSPREDAGEGVGTRSGGSLSQSITALCFSGREKLYAGSRGRCRCLNLQTGSLDHDFVLPGDERSLAAPSALLVIRTSTEDGGQVEHLWIGLDSGGVAVFDVASGALVRCFQTDGPDALVALAHFPGDPFAFALSAHKRVSVWDVTSYALQQKYSAELIMCGADLSAMVAVQTRSPEMRLLLLAGVDGSLCARRVSRRADGKMNCVLLFYMECPGVDAGGPITSIHYHAATDSVLIGDASCTVRVVEKLQDQLSTAPMLPGTVAAPAAVPNADQAQAAPSGKQTAPSPPAASTAPSAPALAASPRASGAVAPVPAGRGGYPGAGGAEETGLGREETALGREETVEWAAQHPGPRPGPAAPDDGGSDTEAFPVFQGS